MNVVDFKSQYDILKTAKTSYARLAEQAKNDLRILLQTAGGDIANQYGLQVGTTFQALKKTWRIQGVSVDTIAVEVLEHNGKIDIFIQDGWKPGHLRLACSCVSDKRIAPREFSGDFVYKLQRSEK